MLCRGEQPAGTQNPNAAPNSSHKQRWFEDFTKVEQSNAAEEFGAFETKMALCGTQPFFNLQ